MEFTNGREDIKNVNTNNVSHQELEERKGFDIQSIVRDENEVYFTYEGEEYSLIPLNMKEEAMYSHLYVVNNKVSQGLAQVLLLTKLVKVPYTKEHINTLIKKDKEWSDLSIEERFDFLTKLKTEYIVGMLTAYNKQSGIIKEEEELGKL